MNEPVYIHAHEPWAYIYLHHNPGWATPRDDYSRWKFASSRKQTAIQSWRLREAALSRLVARYGADPAGWPDRHPTVVVFPTNLPDALCLGCEWIDGSHREEVGARAAGRAHTLESR